jgi:hypothetical protein
LHGCHRGGSDGDKPWIKERAAHNVNKSLPSLFNAKDLASVTDHELSCRGAHQSGLAP